MNENDLHLFSAVNRRRSAVYFHRSHIMFKKILVPLDGSSLAEQAVRPAIDLARPFADQSGRGHLILLRVPVYDQEADPLLERGGISWVTAGNRTLEKERDVRRQVEAYLHTIRDCHDCARLAVSVKVIDGDVAGVIVDTAEDHDIDLIVMATHGRSGLSRWMLGSVTERVLHSAPCPVLTVQSDAPIRHVLITLDGSPLAEKVLGPALAAAEKFKCRVTLLHVEQPIDFSPDFATQLEQAEPGLGEQYLQDLYNQPNVYLERLIHQFRPRGLPIKGAISSCPVVQAILEYAEYHDVDLIAMCTHGRTGLQRWIYGSVTEKTLRSSRCAMLIVRPWH
jgi:nucleotide-binding universal stress UspA family protein